MQNFLRKTLAVLMYLIYTGIAALIPGSLLYIFFSNEPRIKLAVVTFIVAVTFLFFFIEDIRIAGGLKKHFKQFVS